MKVSRRLLGNGVLPPLPSQHRLAKAIALSFPVLAAIGNAAASDPCPKHSEIRFCVRKSHAPILISDTTIERFQNGPHHVLHASQGQWLQATNVVAISHGNRDDSGHAPAAVMAEGLGSTIVFNGGTASSHGNLGNGAEMDPMHRFGTVTARDQGTVELIDVVVTNTRPTGNAVVVQGNGTTAAIQGGRLTSNLGLMTKDGGHALLTDVEVRGQQQGISTEGGHIEVRGGSIVTENSTFRGEAIVSASGGNIELDRVSVRSTAPTTSQGLTGHGAFVIGLAEVHFKDSEILVEGAASAGVQVGYNPAYLTGGLATLTRSQIRADKGVGLRVMGWDSRGQVTDSEIVVGSTSDGSRGLAISHQGTAFVNHSSVQVHGDRAVGVEIIGAQSTAALNGAQLHVYGADSLGVGGSDFAHTQIDNSRISTLGPRAPALVLGGGATAHVSGTHLETTGDMAHGLRVADPGSGLNGLDMHIKTQGAQGHGIDLQPGAKLSLERSSVVAHGTDAHALRAATPGDAVRLQDTDLTAHDGGRAILVENGLSLDLVGGRVSATGAPAIEVHDGHLTLNARDGSFIAGDRGLLLLHGGATATLSTDNGVQLEGHIHHRNGGAIDLALQSQSHWRGATDSVGTLSLAGGSRWALTGNSRVGALTLERSEVSFPAPAAGTFTTLTVAGDFDVQGGTISMHAVLAGDAMGADSLHILGDARGDAHVRVSNVGGQGQATTQGIRLIEVDNQSSAVFRLSGRAVAGPYEYFLHQGGVTTPDDGDWYLRSTRNAPPPSVPQPPPPEQPQSPAIEAEALPTPLPLPPTMPAMPPVLRPEAATYLALQTAASMFTHSWHDRVGAPSMHDPDSPRGGVMGWARLARHQTSHASYGEQLDVSTDTSVLHVGAPLARWGSRRQHEAGLMLASGQARHQVASTVSGFDARGRSEGVAWGAYGTWRAQLADATTYLDGWWQQARYRQHVTGIDLPQERLEATGWTASLEAGAALTVRETQTAMLQLEPQLQLLYTNYEADPHTESNGTLVRTEDAGGLGVRVGTRISGQPTATSGAQVQPFVTFNWRYGASENAIDLDGHRMTGLESRTQLEVAPGAQITFTRGWASWGQLTLHDGDNGYRQVSGQIGLRRAW